MCGVFCFVFFSNDVHSSCWSDYKIHFLCMCNWLVYKRRAGYLSLSAALKEHLFDKKAERSPWTLSRGCVVHNVGQRFWINSIRAAEAVIDDWTLLDMWSSIVHTESCAVHWLTKTVAKTGTHTSKHSLRVGKDTLMHACVHTQRLYKRVDINKCQLCNYDHFLFISKLATI